MFDDQLIKEAMLALDYKRHSKFTYKALWGSAEVEHFIYFGIYRGYLSAEYGLRNPYTEEFVFETLLKYNHPNAQVLRGWRKPRTDCPIRYGFGRIGGLRQTLWPKFYVADIPGDQLAEFVGNFIRAHVFPIVRHVLTLKDLFEFAKEDVEPHPWLAGGNEAARAALIIVTGEQLKLSRDGIREVLAPHDRDIAYALAQDRADAKRVVDRYLENVLSDWRTSNAGASVQTIEKS